MTTSITIKMDLYEEAADPDHEMGVTQETHDELFLALGEFGDNIEIEKRG